MFMFIKCLLKTSLFQLHWKAVMLEVIKFIKADHRVNRIFIADKKIDKEHRTTVIGYTINPEFGEELKKFIAVFLII